MIFLEKMFVFDPFDGTFNSSDYTVSEGMRGIIPRAVRRD
jgi:hypothetical protein